MRVAWLVMVAALGACYSPTVARCSIDCVDGACPQGGTCRDDGFCHFAADEDCPGAPVVMHELRLVVSGEGAVRLPDGTECVEMCTFTMPQGTYDLLSVPTDTSRLGGWQVGAAPIAGCDTGVSCALTLDADLEVHARFEPARLVTLTFSGDGHGRVVSTPAGLDCDELAPECIGRFAPDTPVTLTLEVDAVTTFVGWGGSPCAGTQTTCSVGVADGQEVIVSLDTTRLTVIPVGAGKVTIAPSPANPLNPPIECSSPCDIEIKAGTFLTFATVLDPNFLFDRWVNVCNDGLGSSCTEQYSADRVVIAIFEHKPTVTVNVASEPRITIDVEGELSSQCGGPNTGPCTRVINPGTLVTLTAQGNPLPFAWTFCPDTTQESSTICDFNIQRGQNVSVSPGIPANPAFK